MVEDNAACLLDSNPTTKRGMMPKIFLKCNKPPKFVKMDHPNMIIIILILNVF